MKNMKVQIAVTFGLLIVALILYFMRLHTLSLLVVLASLIFSWWSSRADRAAARQLRQYRDVPNPTTDEVRAFRAQHPELSLAQALLAIKQDTARSMGSEPGE